MTPENRIRHGIGVAILASLGLGHAATASGMPEGAPALVLAQAGSTGGSIGKQGKSVSGDDVQTQQKPAAARTEPAAPARSVAAITGRWRVNQDCNTGKFEIELDLKQSSGTRFSGSGRGITSGTTFNIVDGVVSGNQISFRRRGTKIGLSDSWSATLTAPGAFTGTSRGPLWRCTYTAKKE
jgi:hypothetical protein